MTYVCTLTGNRLNNCDRTVYKIFTLIISSKLIMEVNLHSQVSVFDTVQEAA